MADLESLLNEADGALCQQAPAKARHCLEQGRNRLQRHLENVQIVFDRRADARDHSLTALADVSDRLASLQVDPVVMRWAGEQARLVGDRVEEARSLIDNENFAVADRLLMELSDQINPLVRTAQETQLNEDRRNYIVAGIVQVMCQMGFVVQAGSPAKEHPGQAGSATIIQARRLGGGAVAVSVPQQGEIWYDIDGFPTRMELGTNGHLGPNLRTRQRPRSSGYISSPRSWLRRPDGRVALGGQEHAAGT